MIKTINSVRLNNNQAFNNVQVMPFSVCEKTHTNEPNHRHTFYELIFVVKGKEYQLIDNIVHQIHDNQIFLLSPYNVHNIESAQIEEGIVVTFDENILYKIDEDYLLLQNIIFGFGLNQELIASIELSSKLRNYITILSNEIASPSVNKEIVYSLLKIILISVQEEFTTESSFVKLNNVDLELFYNFINCLNQHFKTEHTASSYANKLNTTPNNLNKIVFKASGKNTLSVIHERIIQESKRLLIHSNKRNKAIAFELGFKDEAYFSRFFKKIVGVSPKGFKRNVQEKE